MRSEAELDTIPEVITPSTDDILVTLDVKVGDTVVENGLNTFATSDKIVGNELSEIVSTSVSSRKENAEVTVLKTDSKDMKVEWPTVVSNSNSRSESE